MKYPVLAFLLVLAVSDLRGEEFESSRVAIHAVGDWQHVEQDSFSAAEEGIHKAAQATISTIKEQGNFVEYVDYGESFREIREREGLIEYRHSFSGSILFSAYSPSREGSSPVDKGDLTKSIFFQPEPLTDNKDTDGDGLSDDIERTLQINNFYCNPLISEFPSIRIAMAKQVETGLDVKVSGIESRLIQTTITDRSSETKTKEVYDYKTYDVYASLKAQASVGYKNLKPSSSGKLELQAGMSRKAGHKLSNTNRTQFFNELKSYEDKTKKTVAAFAADAGYAKTNILLFNPHKAHTAYIEGLTFELYEVDNQGSRKDFPFLSQQNADSSWDKKQIQLRSGGDRRPAVNAQGLSSRAVIDILKGGGSIVLDPIEEYKLSIKLPVDGAYKTLVWADRRDIVEQSTCEFRITTPLSDSSHRVAARNLDGEAMTVESAMKTIWPTVELEQRKDFFEVKHFYGLSNTLELHDDYSEVEGDPDSGRWFFLSGPNAIEGGSPGKLISPRLDSKLRGQGTIILAYLTLDDLKIKPAEVRTQNFKDKKKNMITGVARDDLIAVELSLRELHNYSRKRPGDKECFSWHTTRGGHGNDGYRAQVCLPIDKWEHGTVIRNRPLPASWDVLDLKINGKSAHSTKCKIVKTGASSLRLKFRAVDFLNSTGNSLTLSVNEHDRPVEMVVGWKVPSVETSQGRFSIDQHGPGWKHFTSFQDMVKNAPSYYLRKPGTPRTGFGKFGEDHDLWLAKPKEHFEKLKVKNLRKQRIFHDSTMISGRWQVVRPPRL